MKQLIVGGSIGPLVSAGTRWNSVQGGSTLWRDTENGYWQMITTPGTFSLLEVELDNNPGAGADSYTFTLRKNSGDTTLTVTFAAADTQKKDAVNTVAVVAGDWIDLQCTPADAPANTPKARWSIVFTPTNANESLLLCGAYTQNNIDAATNYFFVQNGMGWYDGGHTTLGFQVIPTAGKIKNLYIKQSVASGVAPDDFEYTLYLNHLHGGFNATALTTTIVGASTTGSDVVHEVDVVAGDLVCYRVFPHNLPANSPNHGGGFTFVSTIPNESILMGNVVDRPLNNANEYVVINPRVSDVWAAAPTYYMGGQADAVYGWKKLYHYQDLPCGAGASRSLTLAAHDGDTTMIATNSGALQTDAQDLINTYAGHDYDTLSIKSTPTNLPAAAAYIYWGVIYGPLGGAMAMGSTLPKLVAAGVI